MSKKPFMLKGRQDLAIHRYNQYCPSKSILLLHGVGSGKTLTSLTMALNSFNWGENGQDRRKIVVVAPSGVFGNFKDELTSKIPNVKYKNKINPSDLAKDTEGYVFTYNEKEFDLLGFKYSALTQQISSSGISDAEAIQVRFKNAVVIFDEAHRLFRPVPSVNTSLLDIFISNNIISKCKNFIAMTGTPYSDTLSDIFKLLTFIDCSNRITNLDDPNDPNEYSGKYGTCANTSIFNIDNNYFAPKLFGFSNATTRRIDFWLFGCIKFFLDLIPDMDGYLTSGWFDWVRRIFSNRRREFLEDPSMNAKTQTQMFEKKLQQAMDKLDAEDAEQLSIQHAGGDNPYSDLNLDPKELDNLSEADYKKKIDKAFRRLALRFHPDKCPTDICKKEWEKLDRARTILLDGYDKIKSIQMVNILNNFFPNKEDRNIYIKTMFDLLSSNKVQQRLKNNKKTYDAVFGSFSDLETAQIIFEASLHNFKKDIYEIKLNKDLYIENTIKNIAIDKDEKLFIDYCPIFNEGRLLKQNGGSLWNGKPGYGTRLRAWIINYFNINAPIDFKKLAAESLKYISYIGSTSPSTIDNFTGVYPDVKDGVQAAKYPGLINTSLNDILNQTVTAKKVETPFKYPSKEVLMFYNRYTEQQDEHFVNIGDNKGGYTKGRTTTPYWWKEKVGKINREDKRSPHLRCIGNFSRDFNTYSSEYRYADANYPKYEIVYGSNKNPVLNEEELSRITFDCPKFRRALQHLFIMKTGKMFSFEAPDLLEDQPHLTKNPTNYQARDDYTPINANKGKGETHDPFNHYYPDYIPKTEYKNATHYFLPLVWSCGGSDIGSPGLNAFAAFLNQLGLKYIVLHAGNRDTHAVNVLEREKIRAIHQVYPIIKKKAFLQKLITKLFKNLETDEESVSESILETDANTKKKNIYDYLKEIIASDDEIKEHPICVLLHTDMTEGIDCKHNPAILLLEPPNTTGDYEQLCGRVLRTYGGNGYNNVPKKMIYQFVCYNSTELKNFWGNRFNPNISYEEIEEKGKGLFYTKSRDVKDDLFFAKELDKQFLARYAPKHKLNWYYYQTKKGFLTFYSNRNKLLPEETIHKIYWAEQEAYMKSGHWTTNWFTKWWYYSEADKAEAAFLRKVVQRMDLELGRVNMVNPGYWDFFYGREEPMIAIMNERINRAIKMFNYSIKRYEDFKQKKKSKVDGKEIEKSQEEVILESQILQDNTKIKAAYKELTETTLGLYQCPDISWIMTLQAEEYQINCFLNEFKEMKFPDLIQIENCIGEKAKKIYQPPTDLNHFGVAVGFSHEKATGVMDDTNDASHGIDYEKIKDLPWCDPFIEPYEKNKLYVCKTVDKIDKIELQKKPVGPLLKAIRNFDYMAEAKVPTDAATSLQQKYTDYKDGIKGTIKYKNEPSDPPSAKTPTRSWWIPEPVSAVEEPVESAASRIKARNIKERIDFVEAAIPLILKNLEINIRKAKDPSNADLTSELTISDKENAAILNQLNDHYEKNEKYLIEIREQMTDADRTDNLEKKIDLLENAYEKYYAADDLNSAIEKLEDLKEKQLAKKKRGAVKTAVDAVAEAEVEVASAKQKLKTWLDALTQIGIDLMQTKDVRVSVSISK